MLWNAMEKQHLFLSSTTANYLLPFKSVYVIYMEGGGIDLEFKKVKN